jgi:hypothetical protein
VVGGVDPFDDPEEGTKEEGSEDPVEKEGFVIGAGLDDGWEGEGDGYDEVEYDAVRFWDRAGGEKGDVVVGLLFFSADVEMAIRRVQMERMRRWVREL